MTFLNTLLLLVDILCFCRLKKGEKDAFFQEWLDLLLLMTSYLLTIGTNSIVQNSKKKKNGLSKSGCHGNLKRDGQGLAYQIVPR